MTPRPTDRDGCIPFKHCAIQISKLLLDLFVMDSDLETKKWVSARARWQLLGKLGGFANPDGTNCFPGDKELVEALHYSARHIIRLRTDLRTLGFVHADGLVRVPGSRAATRKWKLMLPLAAQKALGLLEDEPEQRDKCGDQHDKCGDQHDKCGGSKMTDPHENAGDNLDFAERPANIPANIPVTRKSGATEEKKQAVQRVWDYYIEKLKYNPKLLTFTVSRQKKGMKRLNELLGRTGGDLAKAEKLMRFVVDAVAASPWHCGQNEHKRRFDSWEDNLFKNQEQVEKWLTRL